MDNGTDLNEQQDPRTLELDSYLLLEVFYKFIFVMVGSVLNVPIIWETFTTRWKHVVVVESRRRVANYRSARLSS